MIRKTKATHFVAALTVLASTTLSPASPLDAFQPVERWHTVGKVAAIAGEREIMVSGCHRAITRILVVNLLIINRLD